MHNNLRSDKNYFMNKASFRTSLSIYMHANLIHVHDTGLSEFNYMYSISFNNRDMKNDL